MTALRGALFVAGLLAVACEPDTPDIRPSRIRSDEQAVTLGGTGSNGINYHGGPVVMGTFNIYFIWYGNWTGDTALTLLPDLIANLGGSGYYNINTTYTDGLLRPVSNSIHYGGSASDTTESRGNKLADSDILAIVSAHAGHDLPLDLNGLYMVLTTADVNETSGFCTKYCGWHTHGTVGTSNVRYAFIGGAGRCMSACAWQTTSPNGNPQADAMASIISHELEEAGSDPDANAWFDASGNENADKCAWTFGTTSTAANGSLYNQTLGTHQWLIQQNWLNKNGGGCAQTYSSPSGFSATLSPSGQSIVSGELASSQLTLALAGGFGDPVGLTAADLPPGATVSFNPNPATSTSTMSVTTDPSTPPGDYPVTVIAGTGDLAQATQFTLSVGAPQGYSIVVSPAFASVNAGKKARFDVSINRQPGFTAPVALTVSGLPPGATARFSDSPAQQHSILTIDTADETLGTFPLEVDGAGGQLTAASFATVQVAPKDGPGRRGVEDVQADAR
jgi:hypothetical protein